MWLVIGYGNLLRRDDGAGRCLAEQLLTRQKFAESGWPGRVLAVHQLTPELALELAAAEVSRVLFVDAQRGLANPLLLRKLNSRSSSGSCGHHLTPELLLHMTSVLFQRSPRAWLLSVAAEELEIGEGLSRSTRDAIAEALRRIEGMIRKSPKVLAK